MDSHRDRRGCRRGIRSLVGQVVNFWDPFLLVTLETTVAYCLLSGVIW
jgi:hypothetical protein